MFAQNFLIWRLSLLSTFSNVVSYFFDNERQMMTVMLKS